MEASKNKTEKIEQLQRKKTPSKKQLQATNVSKTPHLETDADAQLEQIEKEKEEDDANILTTIEMEILSKNVRLPLELIQQLQLRKLNERPDHKLSTYLVIPNIPQYEKSKDLFFFRKFICAEFAIVILQNRTRSVAIKNLYDKGQVYQVCNKWREETFIKRLQGYILKTSAPLRDAEEPYNERLEKIGTLFLPAMEPARGVHAAFETHVVGIFLMLIEKGYSLHEVSLFLKQQKAFKELAVLIMNKECLERYVNFNY